MKVIFEKEDHKYFTIAEAPIIKKLIKDFKEDNNTPADVVEYAMHALNVCDSYEVLKASAKIEHNYNIQNYYSGKSGNIDVWIDATIETDNTFYIIGFYLSDAWSVSSENHEKIRSNMDIRRFDEVKLYTP